MQMAKHLENGSITEDNGKFAAYDMKGRLITYGHDLVHCQMEVVKVMREKFQTTPHKVDFERKFTCMNFSVFKKGKGKD